MKAQDPAKGVSVKRLLLGVLIGFGAIIATIVVLSRALGTREPLYQGKPVLAWALLCRSSDATASNQAFALLQSDILPQLTNAMFHDTNDPALRAKLVEGLNILPGVQIAYLSAPDRRSGAASALGAFGPPAKAAVPALIQALKCPDEAVRGPAAQALGSIHDQAETVVPLLIAALDDPSLQEDAAEGLAGFGTLAKAAIPKLLVLFDTNNKDLHNAVWGAVQAIDPDAFAQALKQHEQAVNNARTK